MGSVIFMTQSHPIVLLLYAVNGVYQAENWLLYSLA